MAADLLQILIKTNLAAAAAILLALALRKPARKAFGARVAYVLWLVVPLAAGASLLPARAVVLPYTAAPQPDAGLASSPVVVSAAATGVDPALLTGVDVMIVLWVAGAMISFALLAWSQSRFMRSLGGVVREGRFLRAEATGVGPAVVGAVFPRIVLPADFERRYDDVEQKVVLAHEDAHLASGDAVVNALVALAKCLAWFNPLIHVAGRTLRIDQELACDAAVLAAYPNARRLYAQALLKTQIAPTPPPLGCYWPAGAANPLKERIAMLTVQVPSRSRRLCGGAAILALCLGAGFAAWAAQPATVTLQAAPRAAAASVEAARELKLAAVETRPLEARGEISTQSFPISSRETPGQTTRSVAGNTYLRVDADPIPARLYALRVTLPDGAQKLVTTTQSPSGIFPVEETQAYRAAVGLYAAAKQEEAARMERGAPPQPLTPELEAAFKVMSDVVGEARASYQAARQADLEANYDAIVVVSNNGKGRFTTHVPKNLTAEHKAGRLAQLDQMIAKARPPMRDTFIKAREILAQKPTVG